MQMSKVKVSVSAPQVARCTKIINPGTDEAKYVINVKQIAKVGDGYTNCDASSVLLPYHISNMVHVCSLLSGLVTKWLLQMLRRA